MLIQLPLALIGSDPLFLTKLHQAQMPAVIGIGLSGLTSHYCLTNAFRSGDAGVVVPLDFMRIPLIAVIGWWLYGEPLDGFVFLGAGLIITGILWNLRSDARRFTDPAKPVSYRASRPTLWGGDKESTWGEWLADDQRNAASRPDVLVYESDVLKAPVRVAGQPIAHLFASTSGTDSDWVVKIIDVYPDEDANHPKMAGYQQMISADIFRGRYREDFAKPAAIKANAVLPYAIRLPQINHTFLPGHRMMVQIQSTWFPLYDRNPQTFVPNIMFAKPADFQKATQRVWHTAEQPSAIELPVIE